MDESLKQALREGDEWGWQGAIYRCACGRFFFRPMERMPYHCPQCPSYRGLYRGGGEPTKLLEKLKQRARYHFGPARRKPFQGQYTEETLELALRMAEELTRQKLEGEKRE